jgi:hypothetical protein
LGHDAWGVVYVTIQLVVAVAAYMTVPGPVVVVPAGELWPTLMNIAARAWDVKDLSMRCQFAEIVEMAGKIVKGWGDVLLDQD